MSFFDDWLTHTKHLPTSDLFRTWGGLFVVSAALTRRVYLRTNPSMPPIYPNLYCMLVSPPGTGKDMIIDRVVETLSQVKFEAPPGYGLNLAEESISAKGLVDSLASEDSVLSTRHVKGGNVTIETFHSLIVAVPELGTMLAEYNPALISNLNELYNCRPQFRDRVRSGASKGVPTEIKKPHLAMILGTQPETMSKTFPEEAFKMGFFSRTILIYERNLNRKPLFDVVLGEGYDKSIPLCNYLIELANLSGEFKVTKAFAEAADTFHLTECDRTAVSHHRFEDYNTRRPLHLLKLSMVLSAAESKDMVLDVRHFNQAKEILFQTEALMPKIFSSLISSRGIFSTLEELAHITAERGVIRESEVRRFIARQHAAYEVRHIIEEAIATGHLKVVREDKDGRRYFSSPKQNSFTVIPGGKQ